MNRLVLFPLACLTLTLTLATGCAQEDSAAADPGASPTGTATPEPTAEPTPAPLDGGYLEIRTWTDGTDAGATSLAELYSGHTGPGRLPAVFYERFPLDHCFQIPRVAEDPSFYDFIDAGPSLTLSAAGAEAVVLARETVFSNIFYRSPGLTPADLAPGTAYDLAVEGSATVAAASFPAALRLPVLPVPIQPAGLATGAVAFAGDEPLEIRFQPTGADHVFLILDGDGGQGNGRMCRMTDDGVFTVPLETILALPITGNAVLMATNAPWVEIGGRGVRIIGTSRRIATYTKN